MPTYIVHYDQSVEVEADSEDAALDLVMERGTEGLKLVWSDAWADELHPRPETTKQED